MPQTIENPVSSVKKTTKKKQCTEKKRKETGVKKTQKKGRKRGCNEDAYYP